MISDHTWMKIVQDDLESHSLTLTEAIWLSSVLEVAGCEWRYALIVVQTRNDDDCDVPERQ